jgi:N-acetylglucosamine-6-sulfatase
MPRTRRLLHEQGATFSQYLVTYSLCCPSRSSILRGQYPHNTGVLGNRPPSGGFARFVEVGNEASTVATWLEGAGYYTVLAGKYLNGYDQKTAAHVPPGWSDWHALLGPALYFDYHTSDNGQVVSHGHAPADYVTDALGAIADSAIRKAAANRRPLFLYLAPPAPHLPAEPAPRHAGLFGDEPMPEGASYDEEDVSDKPAPIRERPRFTPLATLHFEKVYRNRLRSMQAVDEMVETLVATLRETGQLDHTYIIYTSDNGWHMGEHRLPAGKNTPYEEDIRLPLVIRGPGVPAGTVISRLALNIDLAPTIADLARVPVPAWVDGRSLAPLWRHTEPARWRSCALVQRGPDSLTQEDEGDEPGLPWGFHALRTEQYNYVEWASGDHELYDLLADPAELHNLWREADPALAGRLHQRLVELSTCKGEKCRLAEDRRITSD